MRHLRAISIIAVLMGSLWGGRAGALHGEPWTGYLLLTFKGQFSQGLNAGQEALANEGFHLLGQTIGGEPHHLLQHRWNNDHTAVIVECRWQRPPVKADFVTALAATLNYTEPLISASFALTVFCPSGLPDCTLQQSQAQTLAYLTVNRAAWEVPSE